MNQGRNWYQGWLEQMGAHADSCTQMRAEIEAVRQAQRDAAFAAEFRMHAQETRALLTAYNGMLSTNVALAAEVRALTERVAQLERERTATHTLPVIAEAQRELIAVR